MFFCFIIQTYKVKPAFFARKFEPVISQEIINDVDIMMGRDLIGKCKNSGYGLIPFKEPKPKI